jgi:DNA-directed RNA polymerase specialized sigma24 family protein
MSDGFEAFVAAHATSLLRTAYLLTGDRAQARDLLQTALIATHRHWNALGDPTAYARQELVRSATGWGRRLRVGHLLADSPLLAGASGLPGFGASGHAEPGPRTGLTTALAELPPRERAALVLRHGEGLSEEAVAAALGIPEESVRGLLDHGLARLRELQPGQTDGARLRAELAFRVAEVAAPPAETVALVLDGARSRRRHRAGLAALAVFVVLVVLVVALTV